MNAEILTMRIKCECGDIDDIEYDENDVEIILKQGGTYQYYSYTCRHCKKIIKARIG